MRNVSDHSDSIKSRNGQWLRAHHALHSEGQLILIAEDSEADIFFLFRVMDQAGVVNPIFVVRDGNEALAYLQGAGAYADRAQYPVPGIVLLDLKLPGPDGLEILRWRKNQPHLKESLFVAVSSYDGVYRINLAYEAGADTFLSKPLASEDVMGLIESFQSYWELLHNPKANTASEPL